MPGQFVAVRGAPEGAQEPLAEAPPPPANLGPHLFAIASSPYAVRRESADLDASIIEVQARSSCASVTSHLPGESPCSCS